MNNATALVIGVVLLVIPVLGRFLGTWWPRFGAAMERLGVDLGGLFYELTGHGPLTAEAKARAVVADGGEPPAKVRVREPAAFPVSISSRPPANDATVTPMVKPRQEDL